ncbi:MAG: DUF2461 domain-containing protein [Desulfarculus sp.]|nr:DUF2461 domain-containing protein [Desulfarculus sp.]
MPTLPSFPGFTPATVRFWQDLSRHNSRSWFEEHRQVYEQEVLAPSRLLVEALGARLQEIAPGIHADPRVNRSLFRINRDTRFSPDKSPYKTHMGLWWWEGEAPRMECSGYYLHLEPPNLMLAAGLYIFPRHLLAAYRQEASDPRRGQALLAAVEDVTSRGYAVGGLHYQRLPRGVAPDLPQADLLRHNGLYAFQEGPIPQALYGPDLVEHCFQRFLDMAPLHQWLLEMTLGAGAA